MKNANSNKLYYDQIIPIPVSFLKYILVQMFYKP